MPAKLFFELSEEKKSRILHAGLMEFAEHGYENSSTNRIVKNACISKGSLFQYFSSKEELYFYILDMVTEEYIADLEQTASALSTELFTRIREYALAEFTWYIQHPEPAKLIIHAFTDYHSELHPEIAARYSMQEDTLFHKLLENIDSTQFLWDKSKTIHLLKWFLKGFNEDFTAGIKDTGDMDLDTLRNKYEIELTEYMKLLKTGIIRKE